MYGASGDVNYTSIDLSSDGSKAASGGYCNDATICGPNNPNPIIALLNTNSITFIWSFFLPTSSSYSKVLAIKWRLDNSKIAVVINVGTGDPLTILLLDPSNGSVLNAV
jgi:hypothetical protein